MSRRDTRSGPLGTRRQRPHHPDGWCAEREPEPSEQQGTGRPWRGARFSDDTPKETA